MNKLGIKTISLNTFQTREYAIEKDPVKIFGKNFRLRIFYKNLKISELNLKGRDIQVYLPNKYKKYATEIDRVFNANVEHGCCGGGI